MVTGPGPSRFGPWLRWSWRDLRSRWIAVIAIALVLAIGSGVYAGLGSTATWRRQSNDASFAALAMHDLRVELALGSFAAQGELLDAARTIAAFDGVDAMRERLTISSQIDSTPLGSAESILVPARLVGMSFDQESPVDAVWVSAGELPTTSGAPAGLLEAKFADDRGLPPQGELAVAGGGLVAYTGLGIAPEDFFYEGPEGAIFSQGELAILYLPLSTAQQLTGRAGLVNELVLTVDDVEQRDIIEGQLAAAVDELGLGATITTKEDADAVRVLYEDIENDQRFWNALSALVLAAAALAAFNLISRIVDAQRREIGIGMALGVPLRRLAIRPLLIGLQIAILGTICGIGVGLLIGAAFGNLLESLLPLPVHRTPFQFGVYAQAAILGLAVPIVASALPVWRAVRVEPIEAIRTGHLAARSSRLAGWTRHVRLPGSSLTLMPLRNVLRSPRRTLLTALGVAAAITSLVAVLGMLDSFLYTLDRADAELTRGDADRVTMQLDTFYPADGTVVESIAGAAAVGRLDVGLRLPARAVTPDGSDLELLVEAVDFDTAAWVPSRDLAIETSEPGIVLAEKAAADLGVEPGASVRVLHPIRLPDGAFGFATSELVVIGIHRNPLRAFAYVDIDTAAMFGLSGATNLVQAYPRAGVSSTELQRAVFDLPGVASSQPVARVSQAIDEALDQFTGFLYVTAGAVLVLALLIAFNASRITFEERRREHATMRAFGLPLRSVVRVVIEESVAVGVLSTALGLGAGTVFLRWMLSSLAETTLPDVGIDARLSPATVGIAAVVGIVAVAAAPLFLIGRLRRMNLPDSLRVME